MGGPQLLEDRGVGRVARLGPLAARQVELVEEDLLELLGTAQVELVAHGLVDARLEPRDLVTELAAQGVEGGTVERDAGRLHACQHGHQRQLELPIELVEVGLVQRRLQAGPSGGDGGGLERGMVTAAQRSRARGSSTSRRSAQMSVSVWLRSAALRM